MFPVWTRGRDTYSEFLYGLQYLIDVSVDLDPAPFLSQHALVIDKESAAFDAPGFLSKFFTFLPDAALLIFVPYRFLI